MLRPRRPPEQLLGKFREDRMGPWRIPGQLRGMEPLGCHVKAHDRPNVPPRRGPDPCNHVRMSWCLQRQQGGTGAFGHLLRVARDSGGCALWSHLKVARAGVCTDRAMHTHTCTHTHTHASISLFHQKRYLCDTYSLGFCLFFLTCRLEFFD